MTKTYAQLKKERDALDKKIDEALRKEKAGVVARIKEAITVYGLTASDLGLGAKRGPKPGSKRAGKNTGKGTTKAGKAKGWPNPNAGKPIRFRDEAGNTWVGRGPRPQWLRDALAAGKKVEDFAQ